GAADAKPVQRAAAARPSGAGDDPRDAVPRGAGDDHAHGRHRVPEDRPGPGGTRLRTDHGRWPATGRAAMVSRLAAAAARGVRHPDRAATPEKPWDRVPAIR